MGCLGRLYRVLNVQIGLQKWPKRAILAVFWTFFKGPMREFAQTALKCSFSCARFTGAIGLDVSFFRGLAQKETRSAAAICCKFQELVWGPTMGDLASVDNALPDPRRRGRASVTATTIKS